MLPLERPKIGLADIIRQHGDAYRERHEASLSSTQRCRHAGYSRMTHRGPSAATSRAATVADISSSVITDVGNSQALPPRRVLTGNWTNCVLTRRYQSCQPSWVVLAIVARG